MIFWMLAIVTGSMPVNGSSSRMILGLETRQRAISSRRRSPPESDRASDLPQPGDVELFEQFLAAAVAGLAVEAQQLHHAQQVLLHGELAEDAGFLGQIAHAALAGPAIHGPVGDVHAVEPHLAGVGHDHAAGHAEAGGLAGPVGAQQADDLAALDAEVDAVDHPPRAVDLHQSFGFEHGAGIGIGVRDQRMKDECTNDRITDHWPLTTSHFYLTSPIRSKLGK